MFDKLSIEVQASFAFRGSLFSAQAFQEIKLADGLEEHTVHFH